MGIWYLSLIPAQGANPFSSDQKGTKNQMALFTFARFFDLFFLKTVCAELLPMWARSKLTPSL
jgi:hypothetical protein